MDIVKPLIYCWSFVWASCIMSLGLIGVGNIFSQGNPLVSFLAVAKQYGIFDNFFIEAAVYTFIVWAVGCIAITLVCWGVSRFRVK